MTINSYFSSTVGHKFLMALSGLVLVGFVIAHLVGNLQVFLGQEAINRYGNFLQGMTELLWPARIFLLIMVVVHIVTSIQLALVSNTARPVAYSKKAYIKASLASRTMMYSGVIVLGFIVYHLLDFTFLKIHPQYRDLIDAQGRHDIYSMMIFSFQQPLICIAYIVPIFFLCAHLSHGISSLFQSLGLNTLRSRRPLTKIGTLLAWIIFIGYALIPIGCYFGWAKLPPGVHP